MKRYKFKKYHKAFIMYVCVTLIFTSCKKFVEIPPPVTRIADNSVFSSDASAISVMTGIYARISFQGDQTPGQLNTLSLFGGLSSDEFTLWDGVTNDNKVNYYKNNLSASVDGGEYWTQFYNYIYTCNAVIEGVTDNKSLSSSVSKQLLGEAYFFRALSYFYLVNLYGDVPLALKSDYSQNTNLSRSKIDVVYSQIISDLSLSKTLLNSNYLDASLTKVTNERVRPTKWVASALLARAYLFTKNWEHAITESTEIIANSSKFDLVPLDKVFLKNSLEAIWQLQSVKGDVTNTLDGYTFVIPPEGPNDGPNPVYLSQKLLNSFELNDQRRSQWVGTTVVNNDVYEYPFKYKENGFNAAVVEYSTLFRLAEMYLIRAEALAESGDLINGAADLNKIRKRAGLTEIFPADISGFRNAVYHERQVELFSEMGARWLDLKRTSTIDVAMSAVNDEKNRIWKSTQSLYPIPNGDIQKNRNLNQNPGY